MSSSPGQDGGDFRSRGHGGQRTQRDHHHASGRSRSPRDRRDKRSRERSYTGDRRTTDSRDDMRHSKADRRSHDGRSQHDDIRSRGPAESSSRRSADGSFGASSSQLGSSSTAPAGTDTSISTLNSNEPPQTYKEWKIWKARQASLSKN